MSFADTARLSASRVETEDFTRSVHALFDHSADADKAHQDLIAAGIRHDAISLHGAATAGIDVAAAPEPGFWERVIGLFVPDDDRHSFAEGLRRGGVAIEVRTDTTNYERVVEILDRDGAVDLDEREQSWRSEGWQGYTARDALAEGAPAQDGRVSDEGEEPRYVRPSAATAGFGASSADHFPLTDASAPPVASPGAVPDDMLESASRRPEVVPTQPWNRDISHGRSRVRSYSAEAQQVRPVDPGLDL